MNAFIRLLYAVLIAIAVVVFVGVGINSVFPGPKSPEYPHSIAPAKDPSTDKEFQKQQQDFDKSFKDYQNEQKQHSKKLSTILIPLAIIIVAGGLWYMKRSDIIGEGVALGGVGTSVYGVIAASMADHRLLRFLAVTVLLAGAILVVQFRFKEPTKKSIKKKT
jgi:H+/gluconate symporter-like permease